MFNLLDDTIRALLDAVPPGALPDTLFGDADISFQTPEKGFAPKQGDLAINLFFYEVKENRDLREPAPIRDASQPGVRRRAPLRVDCAYMVTAWSNITNQDNVKNAHQLLGEAFKWLSRFPVVPEQFVQAGGLTGQLYEPPTMVAQMDGAKSAGEFWSALGIPPRPYFNLIVTICMDLDLAVEDAIVTTISSTYQGNDPDGAEARMMVGGTVRNVQGDPVADAWVRLEPQGETQVTDAQGRFIFERVVRGQPVTLRTRAQGYQEKSRTFAEVPSLTGEYDLVVRLI